MAYFKPGTNIPLYGNLNEKEHTESTLWVGKSENKDNFFDLARTFIEHKGENEIITFNPPETHGSEPLHTQFNLIDKKNKNAFKIKFEI